MTEAGSYMTDDWRALFEATYVRAASPTVERIWRAAFGDAYLDGIDPYSLVSREELTRFAGEVRLERGHILVDVGCGRGGAGLWVAAATGALLVGIDIAEAALHAARKRAEAMGTAATFR